MDGAQVTPFPGFVEVCQPTERKAPPSGEAWLHEIKHEGHRAQAQFCDGAARVFVGEGDDWAARVPSIAASLAALPVNNITLDGELVAVDAKGRAIFYELPSGTDKPTRVKAHLIYYAFDLLYLDGFDVRGAMLADRKRVLKALLDSTSGMQLIKYVDHIAGSGELVLEHACKLELKGIVSKRADAPYRSGRRTDWITTRCAAWRQAGKIR